MLYVLVFSNPVSMLFCGNKVIVQYIMVHSKNNNLNNFQKPNALY